MSNLSEKDKAILKRMDNAILNLHLLEANGEIDGKEGKDRDDGWVALCEGMGVSPYGQHTAYRTAYENGWWKGYEQRAKGDSNDARS